MLNVNITLRAIALKDYTLIGGAEVTLVVPDNMAGAEKAMKAAVEAAVGAMVDAKANCPITLSVEVSVRKGEAGYGEDHYSYASATVETLLLTVKGVAIGEMALMCFYLAHAKYLASFKEEVEAGSGSETAEN
jgi:hypothetical protein